MRYLGGSATQARAALVNTLARDQGKEGWRRVLASLVDQLQGRGLDLDLRKRLYAHNAPAASGLSADQFRAALDRFSEAGVQTLESNGLLNIESGAGSDASTPAWYEPVTGTAHFIPEFMVDADAAGHAMLHEIGEHHDLNGMLGAHGVWATMPRSRITTSYRHPVLARSARPRDTEG